MFEEHQQANFDYPSYQRYVEKYQVNLAMVSISNQVLRNFLFNDPHWKLEKVGIAFDLFSKVTKDNPKEDEKIVLPQGQNSANTFVDDKTRYCIFVRLFGHCAQAPECKQECDYNNTEIAKTLGMNDSMCLRFSQACFTPQTACGNCRDLCHYYKMTIPKLNKKLGTHYPVLNCPL